MAKLSKSPVSVFMPVNSRLYIQMPISNPKYSSHYHLIDFSDSATTRIELPVTAGIIYNGIQFQMGIDSADQNRGAQSGALDPAKGMFWTWNSGYINVKIEGNSPLSRQPAHIFEYHIGGYRDNYNTVWQIKLYSTNDQTFLISKEKKIMIEIGIDLDYLFDGPTPHSYQGNSKLYETR